MNKLATTITTNVILLTSFYAILMVVTRATFRTIYVLLPYVHTLLCNAHYIYANLRIKAIPKLLGLVLISTKLKLGL